MISFLFVLCFIAVHFSSRYMKLQKLASRNKLLSIGSGISVAYVFVHILPKLEDHQKDVYKGIGTKLSTFIDDHVYLFCMLGLVIFYGLERFVKISEKTGNREGVFWIHIGTFAVYNALVGYLTVHGEYEGWKERFYYFIALAVHFVSNDHSLREIHKQAYDKIGRWLLIVSVALGWLIAIVSKMNEAVLAILFALLAGGIILNVLKEELPEDEDSNFPAFVGGIAGYTLLVMAG